MVRGIINAFDRMQFSLVINLAMVGNRAVTWPPIIATRYASFTTTLNTPGSKSLLSTGNANFDHCIASVLKLSQG